MIKLLPLSSSFFFGTEHMTAGMEKRQYIRPVNGKKSYEKNKRTYFKEEKTHDRRLYFF